MSPPVGGMAMEHGVGWCNVGVRVPAVRVGLSRVGWAPASSKEERDNAWIPVNSILSSFRMNVPRDGDYDMVAGHSATRWRGSHHLALAVGDGRRQEVLAAHQHDAGTGGGGSEHWRESRGGRLKVWLLAESGTRSHPYVGSIPTISYRQTLVLLLGYIWVANIKMCN